MLKLHAGYTLIELSIVIAVAVLVLFSIVALFARGLATNRQQFTQVLTTEDARLQLERISDALRSTERDADSPWLLNAQDYAITIRSNVDDDPDAEVVRYYAEQDVLYRGVTELNEVEVVAPVAKGIKNI